MAQHHSHRHAEGYVGPLAAAGRGERQSLAGSYLTESGAGGWKNQPSFHHQGPFFLSDNPNLVSRVVVAIETLDQNDNAPELDKQYTTSMCDSSPPGQVRSLFVLSM